MRNAPFAERTPSSFHPDVKKQSLKVDKDNTYYDLLNIFTAYKKCLQLYRQIPQQKTRPWIEIRARRFLFLFMIYFPVFPTASFGVMIRPEPELRLHLIETDLQVEPAMEHGAELSFWDGSTFFTWKGKGVKGKWQK